MLKARKAQSTLEYIIVFTVIVAAVLLVANNTIKKNVTSMLEHASNASVDAVNHIDFK